MARLTCPYCFASARRRELLFRCVGGGAGRLAGCRSEPDQAYAAYLHEPGSPRADLPPVFPADGRRSRAVCPRCRQVSTRRVCPQCHSELAGDYCDTPSRLVALVGAKNSGKSTYIGVFIHQLLNEVGKELDASLNACDDRTSRRYHDQFERPLYERRQLLPTTQPAAIAPQEPLVYRLTVRRRGRLVPRRHRALTLVLFDTAGEDLTDHAIVDRHLRYLGAADAILFLVDPLELAGAEPDIAPAARPALPPRPVDSPLDVIRRVTTHLRAHLDRPAPKRLDPAVAVALTKIDALRPELARQSPLHRARPRTGALDRADRGLVEEQVRALLERWGAGALHRELAHNYRVHGLFALSALGHLPHDGAVSPRGISPLRVEDPLLWLLHRFRMIPATGG